MAARAADRRTAHDDTTDPPPQGAPLSNAPAQAPQQGHRDTARSGAEDAEREQERQLAEGTESPG